MTNKIFQTFLISVYKIKSKYVVLVWSWQWFITSLSLLNLHYLKLNLGI